jgi:hypothetical protein
MSQTSPPVRAITTGPRYHWFGYYDKHQFDPTDRYVLGMEVGFEGRSPTVYDNVRVGMIDLANDDEWIDLGESRAWCWQQGCMLQWRPGSASEVLWNDRGKDGFVCHILDVSTGRRRTIPHPIYTVAPDGRTAATCDFLRTGWLRPGYGYAGEDPNRDRPSPDDSGIWRVDLETGTAELIVTLAQIAALASPNAGPDGALHWFNHLLFNPDGSRLVFLNRFRRDARGGFGTRMFTVAPDGSDLRLVDDFGGMSHFIWRDERAILAWANRPERGDAFYLFDERTGDAKVVGAGVMTRNGHCSYLSGERWVLNDAYPDGDDRMQELYLYDPRRERRVELGAFHSPPEYAGEWRCDLHPRSARKGDKITIDSTHGGEGRQIYLLDLAEVVGED